MYIRYVLLTCIWLQQKWPQGRHSLMHQRESTVVPFCHLMNVHVFTWSRHNRNFLINRESWREKHGSDLIKLFMEKTGSYGEGIIRIGKHHTHTATTLSCSLSRSYYVISLFVKYYQFRIEPQPRWRYKSLQHFQFYWSGYSFHLKFYLTSKESF